MIGTKLAHYEITSHLGSGGMGDVYQATDTKLGRSVAIKFLPEAFSHDTDRVARFEREARVLASLNHPHIAAIHGLEESSDRKFLVMELVDGETLAERIKRGPIPVDESLGIAKQICEALEAAHEKGIIHRDLKPANIKITTDGKVKVLDFGLAKAFESEPAIAALSNSPTLSMAATNAGLILGTAAYMSPEQARGRTADVRSDVFALGCVLYEMLTGHQLFQGEEVSDILASVLKSDPDFGLLRRNLNPDLLKLLRRCLEKNPKRRWHAVGDLRIEIENVIGNPFVAQDATVPVIEGNKKREVLAWALVLMLALGLAIFSVLYFRAPVGSREMRVEINTPVTTDAFAFAVSPDGQRLVFVASANGHPQLWLRPLDAVNAQPLSGTEDASYPFWSPDSRSIGFFSVGKLRRIDIGGGLPRTIANAEEGRGGTWNSDGIILFQPKTSGGGVLRVLASGGESVEFTKLAPRQIDHRFPRFLPDGRQFLFFVRGPQEIQGIYLGSLESGETKRLTAADSIGSYAPPGWLLFVRQGTLFAQRFDTSRGSLMGDPIGIAEPISFDTSTFHAGFSVSSDGLIAYRSGVADTERQLVWFDRTGKALGMAAPPDVNTLTSPELSPDERHIAIDRTIDSNRDVWLLDLVRRSPTRLTFDATYDGFPLWSPDGSRVVFESNRKGSWDIWIKPASGVGMEELLLSTPNNEWPLSWSKDGRFLLFYQDGREKTGADLWALPMIGNDRTPIMVANTPFSERTGDFSPDGRWVAYETNESGQFEIVVQPFPNPTARWQISIGGGVKPRWSADGKELYYIAPDNKLMAVKVSAKDAAFEAQAPKALFSTRIVLNGAAVYKPQYAVTHDGRFLINETTGQATVSPITLIINWKPPKP